MTKILIVVDMQNDFIDGVLGTREAAAIVPCVIDKIKHHDGPVLYTRDTHTKEYLKTQEGTKLPVEHCIQGTPGWELQDEIRAIAEKSGSPIINKVTFEATELIDDLKALSEGERIEEIERVGLCTDICVISNALTIKTFLSETLIRVDASCCAGVTPESHQTALDAMKMCQIEILNENGRAREKGWNGLLLYLSQPKMFKNGEKCAIVGICVQSPCPSDRTQRVFSAGRMTAENFKKGSGAGTVRDVSCRMRRWDGWTNNAIPC
jgi:nicotinamidase-related amidase